MKPNHIIIQILVLTCVIAISSCSNEVDYGEQYKKTVYMVNSNNLQYQAEHHYGQQNMMEFSVYCASSEPIKQDVTVQLAFNRQPLDSLNTIRALSDPNYIPRVLIPEDNYELPSNLEVIIKSGEQYATLQVPLQADNLDPFQFYTLPMTIVSNSLGYDINPQLQSIVYEPVMVNGYSGNYTGISSESTTIARTVQPSLKALSINKVLLPIHNLSGDMEYLDTNFMVLTIASDGTSVSIAPHGSAKVVDLGESSYDIGKQRFELYYSFTADNNTTFTIMEIIVNVNAPVSEEDEEL